MVESTTQVTHLRVVMHQATVYQQRPQKLLVHLQHVSLKAPDEFFLHCRLITKSFAHLYLASAISDAKRCTQCLGSSNVTVVECS